jgi:glycosyltransferase involved in cell wall biosynthesis
MFEVFSSYGEFIGGDAKQIYDIAKHLKDFGYQTEIINFKFKQKLFFRDFHLLWKLIRMKKNAIEADVVFASGTPFWILATIYLSKKIKAKPIIYITHLNNFFPHLQRAYELSRKSLNFGIICFLKSLLINARFIFLNIPDLIKRLFFTSYLLKKTKRILVSSEFIGKEIKSTYGAQIKYEVLYPIVKTHQFQRLYIQEEEPVILYFGECSISRGVVDLVEAFKFIREKFNNTKLLISAYPQPEVMTFKILQALIKKHYLESCVEFFGKQDDINQVLDRATVVCLPFHNASIFQPPLTLLEAMALGKPVVATSVGSIPEFIINNDTGIIIKPRDINALIDSLKNLLVNENLRKRLGNNAKNLIEERCSPSSVINKLDTILNTLN